MGLRIAALALVLAAGCRAPEAGEPPRVVYGRDACARCGMILSEERWAAGYVDAAGRSVVFDDVGEYLDAASERPEIAAGAWVHDAAGGGWLPAASAVFVRIEGLATPMGTGWAAFASQASADRFRSRPKR